MLATPRPITVLWEPPHDTPPSVPVRRLGPALLLGVLVCAAVYALLGLVMWQALGGVSWLSGWPVWKVLVAYPLSLTHTALVVHERLLPALVLGVGAGLGIGVLVSHPYSATQHIAGPQVLTGALAVKVAQADSRQRQSAAPKDPTFALHPSLVWPRQDWTRHVTITGSVGSGKTQILLPLIAQHVARRTKALVLDTKGDYTSCFRGAILSPWDARTRYWDISADVRTIADAQAFAAALVPERVHGDAHFDNAARAIVTGVVTAVQNIARETGNAWGWRTLSEMLSGGIDLLDKLLSEHYPAAVPLLGKGSDKTQASTLATLAAHTQVISNLARAWGNGDVPGRDGAMKRLSLRQWAQDDYRGTPIVFLHAGPDRVLSRVWLSLATSIAGAALLALPDSRKRCAFLVLDELTAVGRLDIVGIIERGRSKGVCVVSGFQDVAQLREVYGPNIATALSAMVGTHVICQIAPGETREMVAGWCGKRRVAVPTATKSVSGTSSGIHEEMRALVNPADLTSELGPQKTKSGFAVRALVIPGGADLLVLDFPGRKWPKIRRPHVPAKWTLPAL